ncbi:heavy metal-associated domain-containing protein [Mycolicibacterium aubagnense]
MTDLAQPQNEVPGARPIYLDITGMSCGMCSRRVQKALNKIDGVRASVSLTTKTATIETAGDISAADLCDAVVASGYGATPRVAVPMADSSSRGPLRRLVGGILGLTSSR